MSLTTKYAYLACEPAQYQPVSIFLPSGSDLHTHLRVRHALAALLSSRWPSSSFRSLPAYFHNRPPSAFQTNMKILVIVWAALSFVLFAAGVLLVVFSILWRDAGDVVLRFLLPFLSLDRKSLSSCPARSLAVQADTTVTISLGISYLIATLISIPAFFMPPTRLLPLRVLAGYCLIIAVFTLIVRLPHARSEAS